MSLFPDRNLCAVNIQKAFMKLVMIFERGFFVVLTASHLKLNLESELLIFFTTFKLFCQQMKKYCMTYQNSCNSTICKWITSAQN